MLLLAVKWTGSGNDMLASANHIADIRDVRSMVATGGHRSVSALNGPVAIRLQRLPVAIVPVRCDTIEEWERRFCPRLESNPRDVLDCPENSRPHSLVRKCEKSLSPNHPICRL